MGRACGHVVQRREGAGSGGSMVWGLVVPLLVPMAGRLGFFCLTSSGPPWSWGPAGVCQLPAAQQPTAGTAHPCPLALQPGWWPRPSFPQTAYHGVGRAAGPAYSMRERERDHPVPVPRALLHDCAECVLVEGETGLGPLLFLSVTTMHASLHQGCGLGPSVQQLLSGPHL